jgi:general secretion pathway protein D
VQHVDAVELAGTLNEVISGVASNTQKAPSVAPGQKLATLSNKANKTPKRNIPKRGTSSRNVNSTLEGVSVIADEPNNALIIMAQPQQYRMLNKIIKQLDVMPLQVLIDAMIVSVTLTDELEHGVQWRFKNGLGDFDGLGQSTSGSIDVLQEVTNFAARGFSYGLVGSDSTVRATFNAFAKDNKINVLSTPSVMVLNNHEANILVGDSIPTRTGEFTNVSSGVGGGIQPLTNTSIQNVETGVTLNVKPRVNANGVVILEIEQKVNNVATSATVTGSSIDSPTILKREIKSTVAVVDGESIVLGGLISETHDFDNSGIPLLKDIPYLGWLFGTQSKKVEKNELIVVITPRVIVNKHDARKVTDEFKRKLSGIFYDRDGYKRKWNEVDRNVRGHEINADDIDSPLMINKSNDQFENSKMYRRNP